MSRYTSYHGLAGVEYTASKWLFAAFEVQYTSVPERWACRASQPTSTKEPGGLSLQVKVLVGR